MGDPDFLPGSQRQAIETIQTFYCPLMAALALFTGKLNPEVETLKTALNRIKQGLSNFCDECGGPLTAIGSGHLPACRIAKQANEVLNPGDPTALERRRLLKEQDRERLKLARLAEQLDKLGARSGKGVK